MAPSSGHLLVPKLVKIVKFGISKTTEIVKSKLPQSTQATNTTSRYSLQPVRIYAQNQPIHPIAYLKQKTSSKQNRWFSSTRTFPSSKPHGPRYDRSEFPVSRTSKAVSQRGAAPFASTLRPNLSGGTLPRSAGGYGLGGTGSRHFSHTAGVQAQVVQNVSAGVRAFFIGGGKARFDGVDPVTGEKRFRSVSHTEDAVYTQWESPMARSMKGTNLEFKLSPTITALSPVFSSANQQSTFGTTSLNDLDVLDNIATDLALAVKDLAVILADLRVLSAFGDLPISLTTTSTGPVLRIRFPGCDADLVSRLCDEVGVRRGIISEDEAWTAEKDVEMALLFPFGPMGEDGAATEMDDAAEYFNQKSLDQGCRPEELEWRHMLSPPRIESSHSFATIPLPSQKINTPSGYESLRDSDFTSDGAYVHPLSPFKTPTHSTTQSADYEGVEGIYKFLRECEDSSRVRWQRR